VEIIRSPVFPVIRTTKLKILRCATPRLKPELRCVHPFVAFGFMSDLTHGLQRARGIPERAERIRGARPASRL